MFVEFMRARPFHAQNPSSIVPAILTAHAGLVLLAVALAALVSTRVKDQHWAPRLALGLSGVSFHVAHFLFVHPGGPLAAASLGVKFLDYVAVVALAPGVSSLVHFFLLFPRNFAAGEFSAFIQRDTEQQRAKHAASRFAWRRWTVRPARIEAADKALASRQALWQWTSSRSFWTVLVALGWLESALLPVAAPMYGTTAGVAAVVCVLAGYAIFILGVLPAAFVSKVLQWNIREGEPRVRSGAAVISRSLTIALWVVIGFSYAAVLALIFSHSVAGAGLFMLALPVSVSVVALVFLVSTGIATWRPISAGAG